MKTAKHCLSVLFASSFVPACGVCDEVPDVGLKDLPGIFAKIGKGDQEGAFLLQFLDAGDKDAVPFLIERLDARDSRMRNSAANALAAIGPEAAPAIPILRKRLKDEDEGVREGAVWALKEIGTAEAVPALVEALGMPDLDVERHAREGLVRIGMRARPVLEGLLKGRTLDAETESAVRQTLSAIQEDAARRDRIEKSYGFLKMTGKGTRLGPAVGSIADEGDGCRISSLQGEGEDGARVIYSQGLMKLDGKEVQLEYIGPRANPFETGGSDRNGTSYDYFKGGPYLVLVEYSPMPAKSLNWRDFRTLIRVNRGKETTVIAGSGECGG